MAEFKENVIEWITGSDMISLTLSQKRYVNRVKNIARTHENEVEIIENGDGSIFARMPLKALKLYLITTDRCTFPGGRNDDEEMDDEETDGL